MLSSRHEYAGLIIYHGPRECILPFFNQLGFQCPKRKGVADFIQEVVSAKDQKVLTNSKSLTQLVSADCLKPVEPSAALHFLWFSY